MGRRAKYCAMFLLLIQFLCSGSSRRTGKEAIGHVNVLSHKEKPLEFTSTISTTKRDITTPITTVPNLVPTIPTTSTTPVFNPNSNPDTFSPASTIPVTSTAPPTAPTPPVSSSGSWCIASPSASQTALQVALDYACGYGGAGCAAIQPGGSCYNPNSVRDHASYAFNNYYQKSPLPNSCNFGGAAVITSINPSTGACQFPSTSTSSSILNTTNSIGANVFGSVPEPTNPTPSAAAARSNTYAQIICGILWAILFLAKICG